MKAIWSHHRHALTKVRFAWGIFVWDFRGKLFEKSFPHPSKTFTVFLLAYPLRESLSYRFLFSCSALGKSHRAEQTLLNFLLLYADGRIAPASVLWTRIAKAIRPKTLTKVSLPMVKQLLPLPFGGGGTRSVTERAPIKTLTKVSLMGNF